MAAPVLVALLLVSQPVLGEDDFPIAGTYMRDRACTGNGAHRPDLVLHGHAHHGSAEGSIGDVPVRNVAIHVTGEDFARFEL